ncbi:MAG TPA: transposase [Prolixibacteraceae bacterium]|nr:transposase [Prolixibacteraceae bacterium]
MKTDRFTQIYLHFILVVEEREWMTSEEEEHELYQFIHQMVNRLGHRSLAINGIPGHLHLLMEFNPEQSPDETIREIKLASSGFVNARRWLNAPFRWEPGYGAFTYSGSQIGKALEYIRNQQQYHEREQELLNSLSKPDIGGTMINGRILFDFTDV